MADSDKRMRRLQRDHMISQPQITEQFTNPTQPLPVQGVGMNERSVLFPHKVAYQATDALAPARGDEVPFVNSDHVHRINTYLVPPKQATMQPTIQPTFHNSASTSTSSSSKITPHVDSGTPLHHLRDGIQEFMTGDRAIHYSPDGTQLTTDISRIIDSNSIDNVVQQRRPDAVYARRDARYSTTGNIGNIDASLHRQNQFPQQYTTQSVYSGLDSQTSYPSRGNYWNQNNSSRNRNGRQHSTIFAANDSYYDANGVAANLQQSRHAYIDGNSSIISNRYACGGEYDGPVCSSRPSFTERWFRNAPWRRNNNDCGSSNLRNNTNLASATDIYDNINFRNNNIPTTTNVGYRNPNLTFVNERGDIVTQSSIDAFVPDVSLRDRNRDRYSNISMHNALYSADDRLAHPMSQQNRGQWERARDSTPYTSFNEFNGFEGTGGTMYDIPRSSRLKNTSSPSNSLSESDKLQYYRRRKFDVDLEPRSRTGARYAEPQFRQNQQPGMTAEWSDEKQRWISVPIQSSTPLYSSVDTTSASAPTMHHIIKPKPSKPGFFSRLFNITPSSTNTTTEQDILHTAQRTTDNIRDRTAQTIYSATDSLTSNQFTPPFSTLDRAATKIATTAVEAVDAVDRVADRAKRLERDIYNYATGNDGRNQVYSAQDTMTSVNRSGSRSGPKYVTVAPGAASRTNRAFIRDLMTDREKEQVYEDSYNMGINDFNP